MTLDTKLKNGKTLWLFCFISLKTPPQRKNLSNEQIHKYIWPGSWFSDGQLSKEAS